MPQKTNWHRIPLLKYAYLLLIAAWLITLSFIIDNYWAKTATPVKVKQNLEAYIQEELTKGKTFSADTSLLTNLEKATDKSVINKSFFYLYHLTDTGSLALRFWTTNLCLPADTLLTNPATEGFSQLANGYYVWAKYPFGNNLLVQLIPVKWSYAVTNAYLENKFAYDIIPGNAYEINTTSGTPVTLQSGNTLFFVTQNPGVAIAQNNAVSVLLRLAATVLLILYICLRCRRLALAGRPLLAAGILTVVLVLLRIGSYYFPVPLNFRQFELFDPTVYSSGFILRSLGDLLINSLLIAIIVWFGVTYTDGIKSLHTSNKRKFEWPLLAIAAIALVAATFTIGNIIRTLVADSQISFDVINFFSLSKYSLIGFFIIAILLLSYFYFSQKIAQVVRKNTSSPAYYLIIFVVAAGFIYLTFSLLGKGSNFDLYLLIWLCIYILLTVLPLSKPDIFTSATTRLITWLFFFSVSATVIVQEANRSREFDKRKHYAEILAAKASPSSETLMNTLLTDFRNEVLVPNFSRFKNAVTAQVLKDSLTGGNFSALTNKYDTRIYCFDEKETALFNTDSASFNTLNAIFTSQAKPTSIPDLFYYDEAFDKFSFIAKKTVSDTARGLLGFVFIVASPKNTKADALYPELFSRGEQNAIENSQTYAFAVYNNLKLIVHHNDYPFATSLQKDTLHKDEFEIITKGGFSELWHKAGQEKFVVIAKQQRLLLEAITLFSYLFCSLLLVSGIFGFVKVLTRLRPHKLASALQVSIRSQVHGIIIFIIVISFLVIGAGTILFFISRYENTNREKLSRTINVMEKEVRNSLPEVMALDDVIHLYDDAYKAKLEKIIIKISEIHAADVNVYDLDGNLQVASLSLPYQKGIISSKMNPEAFYHLNSNKEVQYFTEEKIGKLKYLSNYIPVLDETGKVYAYLHIPYFTSESKLKQEISNFLVTIINLNAFIFLIAGLLALFITNRITRSFAMLSNKMKDVKLGNANEAIEWKRNDEIGQLVQEYNKMVAKLDESADLLAKTERESAWRQMARQVAHEIRNPLTPMKLSLQYLQKAIDGNASNVKELTANVANTLVDQIEHLNSISAGFLQFANIDNPVKSHFNINEVIQQVVSIHSMGENVSIHFEKASEEITIYADATHINRLFTNLIQNAVQAAEGKSPEIFVTEKCENENLLIAIKDNGNGIPAEIREKIFTPNFTTKTSGSGLGLAMCKGIVEKAGGNIWFDTEEKVGTTFYIQLPIATAE